MKNKGIAIRTILLLLIGVLVAGILIYLVYSYGTGSATLSISECISKVTSWCTACMTAEWQSGLTSDLEIRDCGNKIRGGLAWNDNTNCGAGSSKNDCCNAVNIGC